MKRYKKILISVVVAILIGAACLMSMVYYQLSNERMSTFGTMRSMSAIRLEIVRYRSVCKTYPETLNDVFGGSKTCPDFKAIEFSEWQKKDRWQHEFLYSKDDQKFRLISTGNSWIETTEEKDPVIVEDFR